MAIAAGIKAIGLVIKSNPDLLQKFMEELNEFICEKDLPATVVVGGMLLVAATTGAATGLQPTALNMMGVGAIDRCYNLVDLIEKNKEAFDDKEVPEKRMQETAAVLKNLFQVANSPTS